MGELVGGGLPDGGDGGRRVAGGGAGGGGGEDGVEAAAHDDLALVCLVQLVGVGEAERLVEVAGGGGGAARGGRVALAIRALAAARGGLTDGGEAASVPAHLQLPTLIDTIISRSKLTLAGRLAMERADPEVVLEAGVS